MRRYPNKLNIKRMYIAFIAMISAVVFIWGCKTEDTEGLHTCDAGEGKTPSPDIVYMEYENSAVENAGPEKMSLPTPTPDATSVAGETETPIPTTASPAPDATALPNVYYLEEESNLTPTPLPLPTLTPNPTKLAVTVLELKKEGKNEEIIPLLQQLKIVRPKEGEKLEKVLQYWDETQKEGFVRHNGLPEDLPKDDSLCIIGLGYKLNTDGTMRDELIGRLHVLLACAEQYPNAYILVSGGGTASEKLPNVTEAGCMAQWLIEHGVEEKRIITDKGSVSTYDNILLSTRILKRHYPSVTSIAVVTSDYHIPRATLFFTAYFIKNDCPLTVVANAAYTTGKGDTESPEVLGKGVERIFGLES